MEKGESNVVYLFIAGIKVNKNKSLNFLPDKIYLPGLISFAGEGIQCRELLTCKKIKPQASWFFFMAIATFF